MINQTTRAEMKFKLFLLVVSIILIASGVTGINISKINSSLQTFSEPEFNRQAGDPYLKKAPLSNRARESINGKEYILLNLVELNMIIAGEHRDFLNERYSVRGVIYRDDTLNGKGQMGLLRLSMVCCVADAIAFGIRVKTDKIDVYAKGDWIKIYGSIKKDSEKLSPEHENTEESSLLYINKEYLLIPESMEKIEVPKDPYIMDWRSEEPFAY